MTKRCLRWSGAEHRNAVVRHEGPEHRESNSACHLSHASPETQNGFTRQAVINTEQFSREKQAQQFEQLFINTLKSHNS